MDYNLQRRGPLKVDAMRGFDLLNYYNARAKRPTILRPWHSECLILRSGDTRISARDLTPDGATERCHGRSRPCKPFLPARTADRIGLTATLDRLRRHDASLIRVELVRINSRLLDRVCRWPDLPENCSAKEAARLLGVDRLVIQKWCKQGKLVKEPYSGPGIGRGRKGRVRYVETDPILRRQHGRKYIYPERAKRLMCPDPDVDWAVGRFRSSRRSEPMVRITETIAQKSSKRPRRPTPFWVCPTCHTRCRQLFLPAGPMAASGRTFAAWQFQCLHCTGILSEASTWGQPCDPLGRTILKMTLGRVGGREFRRALSNGLSGNIPIKDITPTDDDDDAPPTNP
jgi:hypothetical protein